MMTEGMPRQGDMEDTGDVDDLARNVPVTADLLSTYSALIDTICTFLTVTTHHILYTRRLYPPISFLATRAYNYPVRQNRHPEVCGWINDAVAAVQDQLEKNTVEMIAICIYECNNYQVLERWTLDLRSLPVVAYADQDATFDSVDDMQLRKNVNLTDLEANFRAMLSRLDTVSGKMQPLPDGDDAPEYSFTITIEVKDLADPPAGRLHEEERRWVAAEPAPYEGRDTTKTSPVNSKAPPGGMTKTYPVRRLEAGELRMEMFVEESNVKSLFRTKHKTTLEKAADLSYGPGMRRFDPENGYETEGIDINKKPQGGAFTDYQRG